MERLHPAYFALVMATGIVAIACHLLGLERIAQGLLPVNVAAYATLAALNLARAVRYPARFVADLTDHQRGVGFFTAVAATGVLGSQALVVHGGHTVAAYLLALAVVLWAAVTYTVFTALTVKETKPSLAEGINGGWLVAVVATQSIASLSGLLLSRLEAQREPLAFVALSFWLFGGMLYIWTMSLIFYRYTFFTLSPTDLQPPYWINMGAMAISTLSGVTLVANAAGSPLLLSMDPFLRGFTVLFWATATWWIPMLVILGAWRHVYRRVPLRYDPLYWGAVFPLGMYSVATFRLAAVFDLPFLLVVPRVFVFVALAAWTLTFTGLVRSLATAVKGPAHASL
jgi:tellurite resistance protein TehA-like permease